MGTGRCRRTHVHRGRPGPVQHELLGLRSRGQRGVARTARARRRPRRTHELHRRILGIPFQAFYSASKFALEGYAESLAYEVAPFNIHVTLIEPGNFKTDFTAARKKIATSGDDPYAAACEKAIHVMERDEQRGADPADVAKVVRKVLLSKNPPRRVSVGKFDERMGIMGKRLLPFRLFEKAAKGSLGV